MDTARWYSTAATSPVTAVPTTAAANRRASRNSDGAGSRPSTSAQPSAAKAAL
jgi:hypothetical protein